MAIITDYATLKTYVADVLARSDLTTFVPNFIEEGEERIYQEVKARDIETALSDTIASGVISIPTGFVEFKHVRIDGSPSRPLNVTTANDLLSRYPTRSSDAKPCYIASDAGSFIFGPYPDSTYTVKGTYYKRLDALSDSNTDNWLTDTYPYLILYASLSATAPFIGDDNRVLVWEQRYQTEKDRINKLSRSQQVSGSAGGIAARRV